MGVLLDLLEHLLNTKLRGSSVEGAVLSFRCFHLNTCANLREASFNMQGCSVPICSCLCNLIVMLSVRSCLRKRQKLAEKLVLV